MWDLSSLIRDQTQALCSKSMESELLVYECTKLLQSCLTLCNPMGVACQAPLTTGPPREFPGIQFFMLLFYSPFCFCRIDSNDSIFTYDFSNLRPLSLFLFNLAKELSILLILLKNQLLVPLIFLLFSCSLFYLSQFCLSLLFPFCFFWLNLLFSLFIPQGITCILDLRSSCLLCSHKDSP